MIPEDPTCRVRWDLLDSPRKKHIEKKEKCCYRPIERPSCGSKIDHEVVTPTPAKRSDNTHIITSNQHVNILHTSSLNDQANYLHRNPLQPTDVPAWTNPTIYQLPSVPHPIYDDADAPACGRVHPNAKVLSDSLRYQQVCVRNTEDAGPFNEVVTNRGRNPMRRPLVSEGTRKSI